MTFLLASRKEEALECFQLAIQANERYIQGYLGAAQVLNALSRFPEARELTSKGIEVCCWLRRRRRHPCIGCPASSTAGRGVTVVACVAADRAVTAAVWRARIHAAAHGRPGGGCRTSAHGDRNERRCSHRAHAPGESAHVCVLTRAVAQCSCRVCTHECLFVGFACRLWRSRCPPLPSSCWTAARCVGGVRSVGAACGSHCAALWLPWGAPCRLTVPGRTRDREVLRSDRRGRDRRPPIQPRRLPRSKRHPRAGVGACQLLHTDAADVPFWRQAGRLCAVAVPSQKDLERVLQLNPSSHNAHVLSASLHMVAKNWEASGNHFGAAFNIMPSALDERLLYQFGYGALPRCLTSDRVPNARCVCALR
jgi:hypothetical protein